jgi:hypothetical protein
MGGEGEGGRKRTLSLAGQAMMLDVSGLIYGGEKGREEWRRLMLWCRSISWMAW